MDRTTETPFKVQRLGIVMTPDPQRPDEVEGVLNPGAARGPDGELYLFPRLVGENHYSRVGIARVIFDADGRPTGVQRLGYALEPHEPYELRPHEGSGGCEDPRVTFVEPLGIYVMVYAAWGPEGPRLALAISEDLLSWRRLGLVDFAPDVDDKYGVLFNRYDNKDGAFGPEALMTRDGRQLLLMLHRPMYQNTEQAPRGTVNPRPSIWVSGCDLEAAKRDIRQLCVMREHTMLVDPERPWENLRIGGGTPPVRTRLGIMMIYHGVSGTLARVAGERNVVNYTAGVLIMRREQDRLMQYRSSSPILIPEAVEETAGAVDNVVFPTGIDDRGGDVFDVYYGMADRYIGAFRMWLPEQLPDEGSRSWVATGSLGGLD